MLGEYDDSLSDRFSDPMAGAFSYYTGQMFVAERDISAGEELFANYGEEWLDARSGGGTDSVPRKADFEKAGDFLMRFVRRRRMSGVNEDKGSYAI